MKIIEKLSDMISDEIEDAERYARCAIMHKEDMPDLAETFYKLSTDEMGHMAALHDQVTRIISNYKRQNGEPPANMLAVYEYLHAKQIDKASEVKMLQSMYRG